MRPLLIIEGTEAERRSRRAVDEKIFAFLSEEFSRVALLPSAGKAECLALVSSLNSIMGDYSVSLKAHALLDRDVKEEPFSEPNVHVLPVSMVENFLVDPMVIWNATVLVRHKMELRSEGDVETALTEILDDLEDSEVDRRVKGAIGAKTFRVRDPVSTLSDQVAKFSNGLKAEMSDEQLTAIREKCEKRVKEIVQENLRREFYRGKSIFEEFYKRYLQQTGMSKEVFIYSCAREARKRKSVVRFVDELMTAIGIRQSGREANVKNATGSQKRT